MGEKVSRPQHDGPVHLSLLLDQLETVLPVLVNTPALRSPDWLNLSRRLSRVRTVLGDDAPRRARLTRRHRGTTASTLFQ